MNLHDWDTVSIMSIDLVNRALEQDADRLVTRFDYKEGEVHLAGRFGAWRIVPGGGPRLLHVEIPIREGALTGLPEGETQDLSGTAVRVEIALHLVPAPGGRGRQNLCFDLDETSASARTGADGAGPVVPLGVVDPDNKLSELAREVLPDTIVGCLAAHADQISYVFASVDCDVMMGPCHMPHVDWRYIETVSASCWLAILGAAEPVTDSAQGIDPALLQGAGAAVFAVSARCFLTRLLLPCLQQSFRPSAPFAYDSRTPAVRNVNAIQLPDLTYGGWPVAPRITSLEFTLQPNALKCVVDSTTAMPLGATFKCAVTFVMPLVLNPATHQVAFQPDRTPEETHSIGLPGILDKLLGWLVNWLVGFIDQPISQMVRSIAVSMERINTPERQPVYWTCMPDFRIGAAKLDACLWLCDTRTTVLQPPGGGDRAHLAAVSDCLTKRSTHRACAS